VVTCPACGRISEADPCPVCEATPRPLSDTVGKCAPIIAVSLVANLTINLAWPWLRWGTVAAIVMLVPVLGPWMIDFVLALVLQTNFTRRDAISKRGYIGSAALSVLFTGFCLFNVALDNRPPQEVPAVVIGKVGLFGKSDHGPYLVLSMSWNQVRIEKTIQGDRHILSTVVPGDDAIHLIVHPGAFSVPWYDYTLSLK
jgi:hypothetical protein